MKISAYRNRLAVDTSSKDGINEVRNGGNPFSWNGSAVQFEIALFDKAALIDDISNIDQVKVEVKPGDDRTGLALMTKVLDSGDLNGFLTEEDWEGGLEDDCHALVSFDGGEADLDLEGEVTKDFWLVISCLRTDGEPITFGATLFTIEEDGRDVAVPSFVTTPIYLTLAQSDARYVLALDLSTIENNVATLQTQMTSVTATANAALPKAGGTMTGALTLSGAPSASLHSATKAYVDTGDALALPKAGGTMTGALVLSGAPTVNLHAATKLYVDTSDALALPKSGGTMTGHVALYTGTNPTGAQALSKGYADNLYLALAGGTLTGALVLSGAPTINLHAATKLYVDTADATKLSLSGGTMTGHVALYTGTNPTGAQGLSKGYADTLYLPFGGGTLTGALTLSGAPTVNLHAATKLYVDTVGASLVPLAGGTMTGALQFSNASYGLRLNNFAFSALPGTAQAGTLVYDTTNARLMLCTNASGPAWKAIDSAAGSGAATWYSASGNPSGGVGANGDFYVDEQDGDTEGTIWKKAAGVWGAIVGPKLSTSGGNMTGTLNFAGGLTPSIGWGTSGFSIQEYWNGSNYELQLISSGIDSLRLVNGVLFNDNGAVQAPSFKDAAGLQLLQSRRTGWAAPTGTATRSTFATGSVTLSNLAERVKALIDDLNTHGLIGP